MAKAATPVNVKSSIVKWSLDRSRLQATDADVDLRMLEKDELEISFKELKGLASKTHTPIGYFFLDEPPAEPLGVADFRTLDDLKPLLPSANLIETIYAMERRRNWLREELIELGEEPLPFVGSASTSDDPAEVAQSIRKVLGLSKGWDEIEGSWTDAIRALRKAADRVGIVIIINGIVANNTHRKLDVSEFRGFVLSDRWAPFIFVNNVDAKAAQMFTLAHELAHIWINKSAVFSLTELQPAHDPDEIFCNKVAAEFLVPSDEFHLVWRAVKSLPNPYQSIARKFKVSPIVAARRALDSGVITKKEFFAIYNDHLWDETKRPLRGEKNKGGGNFYLNQNTRVGRRFGEAVIRAARSGRLSCKEAYRLTELKGSTFDKFASHLGFPGE